ncbi:MAG: sensor histidine kinase [Clostridiaceae bacterium]|nr:sensor histidine kinase [Clostridiaceae bacterium]
MINKIKNLIINSTIRQRLTALFIVFVLYPVIIVTFFGYFKYAKDIRSEIIKSLAQNIERVNELTDERFEQTRKFAMMIPYDGTLNQLFLKRKDGEITENNLYKDLTNYLYSKFYSKQEIMAVSFFFTDDSSLVYMVHSDNSYHRYMNYIHPVVVSFADQLEEQFGYYVSEEGEIYIIRKMFDRFSFKQYGTFVIKVDKNYMLKYFENEFPKEARLILTYNDNIIYRNGVFEDKDQEDHILNIIADNEPNSTIKTRSYEVLTSSVKLDNIVSFKYGVIMPARLMMDKYYSALKILILLTGIVALSMLLVALPLSRAMWSPISELVELMNELKQGNLGVQSDRSKNDEFKFIFDTFNKMSNEIKYLFDVVYKEELARKEAQLAALQARINPHFLYNTLEIMNWKARIAENTELSEMIEALGVLMDAGMNKSGQKVGKVKDELKLVEAYMFIMNKRFGSRLKFEKQIDESALDGAIPILLIQPLLENAVMHGIEPVGGGVISLIIKLEEKRRLKIIVEDDGAGISDKNLEEFQKLFRGEPCNINNSTGIGIRNVHNRIQILYGREYGLTLEKGKKVGTVATITIPFII